MNTERFWSFRLQQVVRRKHPLDSRYKSRCVTPLLGSCSCVPRGMKKDINFLGSSSGPFIIWPNLFFFFFFFFSSFSQICSLFQKHSPPLPFLLLLRKCYSSFTPPPKVTTRKPVPSSSPNQSLPCVVSHYRALIMYLVFTPFWRWLRVLRSYWW